MAALNFPDNPNVNDVFTAGAREWIWDGSVWVSNSGREYTRIISENAPSDPIEGDEWYEPNTGKLYIYFNDNWVQQLGFNPTKSIRSESANTALVSGDANQVIRFTGASLQTLTIDDVLEVGDRVDVIQDNSGQVEFSSGSGVNLLSTSGDFFTSGQNAKVEVMCVAAGEYRLYGDLGEVVPDPEIEYLIIAGGGGGGGRDIGGGGGAGGYRSAVVDESSGGGASAESVFSFDLETNYTVTVGAGGVGGTDSNANRYGRKGSDSTFASITSIGGGGGREYSIEAAAEADGGSGGGGSGLEYLTGGSGTANQGFDGGLGVTSSFTEYGGAGGGGAGQVGQNAADTRDGGDGIQSNITGTLTYRAGGGGGAGHRSSGNGTLGDGGLGGGGDASDSTNTSERNGQTNTGGGAGASRNTGQTGGNGGSGIVILRYPNTFTITIGAGLTGTENTDGDFKYAEITAGTGNVSFS